MNLQISSNKIGNPVSVQVLRALTDTFNRMQQSFYVIGATARDIILAELAGVSSPRRTCDIDIAIAIPNWDAFTHIQEQLIKDGFVKDTQMYQRFIYDGFMIDIVPYGIIAKEDGNIYWPPEEAIAMSVKGFDEILARPIPVTIDNDFTIQIASLQGLFALKLNAWLDRHLTTKKDAEDMHFILKNYYFVQLEQNPQRELPDIEPFDTTCAGAYWLAQDLLDLLSWDLAHYYHNALANEIAKEEESLLINHIIESMPISYEDVYASWKILVDTLKI